MTKDTNTTEGLTRTQLDWIYELVKGIPDTDVACKVIPLIIPVYPRPDLQADRVLDALSVGAKTDANIICAIKIAIAQNEALGKAMAERIRLRAQKEGFVKRYLLGLLWGLVRAPYDTGNLQAVFAKTCAEILFFYSELPVSFYDQFSDASKGDFQNVLGRLSTERPDFLKMCLERLDDYLGTAVRLRRWNNLPPLSQYVAGEFKRKWDSRLSFPSQLRQSLGREPIPDPKTANEPHLT